MNATDDPESEIDIDDDHDVFTDIKIDETESIELELPIPLPFEGWIYKQSRYFKMFRKRFCVISLKHAIISTYTNESKLRCTETIRLRNYMLNEGVLNDPNIIDKLSGLKVWDGFVLSPIDGEKHETFLFCGSCSTVGCWDNALNSKYMKNAVICAMSYRYARLAIKKKEWMKAKFDLLLFACNRWTLEKYKNNSLNDRFREYEKWIKIALELPFNLQDTKEVKQQCKILRSYAYYMMNVYGDRCDELENIYQNIIGINPNDAIALTYYGKWLLYGSFDLLKAEACLRKAIDINKGCGVFLNDYVIDDNIKSIRFGKPIYAETILHQCLKKQGRNDTNTHK